MISTPPTYQFSHQPPHGTILTRNGTVSPLAYNPPRIDGAAIYADWPPIKTRDVATPCVLLVDSVYIILLPHTY